jgi:WD40 repeat protein
VLKGHTGGVTRVVFSPNGRILASTGEDGTVRLWDVATRKPRGAPLRGHEKNVTALAFSHDGRLLATGGSDQQVLLWDVRGGRRVTGPLSGHRAEVSGLAFAGPPDSPVLVSASAGRGPGAIFLWPLGAVEGPEQWRARACWMANRNLLETELQSFIGVEDLYESVCPNPPHPKD